MIANYEIVLRLVLSAVIGGLIGIEREANNRPAGLRTHVLVTLGASLIMLISIDGFNDLGQIGDPARLAAQVVSGIGFLGAGTILRTGNHIRGLTTAASLWVCAGIGLAIGNGYYVGGMTTAGIALFTLMSLSGFEKKIFIKKYRILIVECKERNGLIGDIGQVIGKHNITIKDVKIVRNDSEDEIENDDSLFDFIEELDSEEIIEVHFALKVPKNLNKRLFFQEVNKVEGVQKSLWQEDKGSLDA